MNAIKKLDFDLSQYDDFPIFFRDDSTMVIAQAGTYVGVEAITEYVQFTSVHSPYLNDAYKLASSIFVKGFDQETGQCIIGFAKRNRFWPNPETTNNEIVEFDAAYMGKIYFDLEENYVSRVHLHFPAGLLRFTFGELLNSDGTRQYVCDNLAGLCAPFLTEDTSDVESCKTRMAALPVATGDLYVDGDSSGCRALHASFVNFYPTSAENHCAHLSLSTTDKDPNGKIKCSVSKNVAESTLWTDKDMQFFSDFAKGQGMDPDVGFIHPSPEFVEPGWFAQAFTFVGNSLDLVFGGFFQWLF